MQYCNIDTSGATKDIYGTTTGGEKILKTINKPYKA